MATREGRRSLSDSPANLVETRHPQGVIRVEGGTLADDAGPYPWLGCTLFYAPWAYAHDPRRIERAWDTLRAYGFNFYRAIHKLGGASWADRMLTEPDGTEMVMAMVDLGFTYGLRAVVTIFGDTIEEAVSTPAKRRYIVERYAERLPGREHKFLAIEIVNESQGLSVGEIRDLGEYLQSRTAVPIILTCPSDPMHMYALYDDARVKLVNMHFEREIGSHDGGRFEPIWKPFEFPWHPQGFEGDYPSACVSLEPIGPYSSGRDERDPLRLTLQYVFTSMKCAATVLHHGSGMRGGGVWDTTAISGEPRNIPAHFDEAPGWNALIASLNLAHTYLPMDGPNWECWNGHWPENPLNFLGPGFDKPTPGDNFDGKVFKCATFISPNGRDFLAVVLRLRQEIEVPVRRSVSFDVLNPRTGESIEYIRRDAGDKFTLTPRQPDADAWHYDGDGLVLKGELR